MLLVVDNGSVYTKNLLDFLSEKKIEFKNKKHDQISLDEVQHFNSFILSGRRKNNQEMNALNSKIIQHAISEKKNLLGICYGAEILAITTGGAIKKKHFLEKGIKKITIYKENPLCKGKIDVFESHNYEISRINNSLVNLADSKNCLYEMIQLKKQNIFGTQFHPEMSPDGQAIIEAFVSL
ncbi:MAG: type 1 glutamine amidotransferase [Nitrosopumilaceae archaeon]